MEIPGSGQGKSFWERPEGTAGMIFGLLAIAAGVVGLGLALPFLIGLVQNLITLVGLGLTLIPMAVLLFAMLWVVMDKRFWTLGWYLYKSAMRKITSMFVEIDPIGIMKSYVESLQDKRNEMARNIKDLSGQFRVLGEKIQANQREGEAALKMAAVARRENEKTTVALESRKAGRLKRANIDLIDLHKKIELTLRVLKKYHDVAGVIIADIEHEVKVQEDKRSSIRKAYGAFKQAMAIFNGDPDKMEMFNMAMESVANDYGQKLGEIEYFIDSSESIIKGIDLQNMQFEEEALAMLDEWESKADDLLMDPVEKRNIMSQSYSDTEVLDVDALGSQVTEQPVRRSKYLSGN
ncbi:MAG TPA: hypothetical protein VD862_00575 [Candidatus Paceibacterota bacterium]|nr:hypothetical protein [Candidatus Paceibacterota bacterium]